MKYIAAIILLFLAFNPTFGQEKTLNVPSIEEFNNNQEQNRNWCNKLKISYLPTDTNSFFFRFWSRNQYADIWTNDFKTFNGSITNYAIKADAQPNEKESHWFFYSQIIIDTALTKSVYQRIVRDTAIPVLLKKDSVLGCCERQDPNEGDYIFEISSKTNYTIKVYYDDYESHSLCEPFHIICLFIDKLRWFLKLDKIYDDFTRKLPPGEYKGNHHTSYTYKRKYYRQMRRFYRKEKALHL
jgi:hypothetical protein